MIVHQALSGAGPFDAITTEALAFRELFTQWGWGGRDVAASIDPRMGDRVGALGSLVAGPGTCCCCTTPRTRRRCAGCWRSRTSGCC